MLATLSSGLIVTFAAEAESPEKVNHWLVGVVLLVLFCGALGILMAFARGRDHS